MRRAALEALLAVAALLVLVPAATFAQEGQIAGSVRDSSDAVHQIKALPTSRNVSSLLALTPGIQSNYRPSAAFGAPGVCVGGIGVFCNPGVNGFNVGDPGTFAFVGGATTTDQTNLAQGRVLVDGQLINAGASVPIVGQTGGYTADIANAQEVNIKVSGALGESETGGSEINIVPKTGGNRFAGDYNSTFTTERWFATNNQNYSNVPAAFQPVKNDHDVSLAFGGRSSAIGSGSSRSGASRGSTSCRWASTSGPTRGKASVRRALRAGPVDRAAHHSRLRAPLRSRDERVR